MWLYPPGPHSHQVHIAIKCIVTSCQGSWPAIYLEWKCSIVSWYTPWYRKLVTSSWPMLTGWSPHGGSKSKNEKNLARYVKSDQDWPVEKFWTGKLQQMQPEQLMGSSMSYLTMALAAWLAVSKDGHLPVGPFISSSPCIINLWQPAHKPSP